MTGTGGNGDGPFDDEDIADSGKGPEARPGEEWCGPADDLVEVADALFEECEEDVACIAELLDGMDEDLRWELLDSTLLNAWQVFFYFFRQVPDTLTRERLELEPAVAASSGILLEEFDLLELLFIVKNRRGFIGVSDGEHLLAHYEGAQAMAEARSYAGRYV